MLSFGKRKRGKKKREGEGGVEKVRKEKRAKKIGDGRAMKWSFVLNFKPNNILYFLTVFFELFIVGTGRNGGKFSNPSQAIWERQVVEEKFFRRFCRKQNCENRRRRRRQKLLLPLPPFFFSCFS